MAMGFMPGILRLLSSLSKSRAFPINKRQRSLIVYIVSVGQFWILLDNTQAAILLDAHCIERRARRSRCCKGHYSSSQNCWILPTDMFHVNRHISMMSEEVFFSCNHFIVDVGLPSYPASLTNWRPTGWPDERIPGFWNPKHSNFLHATPPGCIPILRSLTWRFPMYINNHALTMYNSDAALTHDLIKHDWICTMFGHFPGLPSPWIWPGYNSPMR